MVRRPANQAPAIGAQIACRVGIVLAQPVAVLQVEFRRAFNPVDLTLF